MSIEHLAGEVGALALLLADRQQADARRRRVQDLLGVEVAHHRELAQVLGLGVDVGADVEHHACSRCWFGSTAASAGRSTPSMVPITILAAIIAAPVLPAETMRLRAALPHQVGADADRRARASCGSA